jgi:hypothetical protein
VGVSPGAYLGGHLRAALLGTALGLVRPYDLASSRSSTLRGPVHGDPAGLAAPLVTLAGLLPVVLYDAWLFFASADFAVFSSRVFQFPPRSDFVWALGPAALLAASWWGRRGTGEQRTAALYLVGWAAAGALILAFRRCRSRSSSWPGSASRSWRWAPWGWPAFPLPRPWPSRRRCR